MAELVGGAFLSSFLNVLFDRMASRPVIDFISGKKNNNELLMEELRIKLLTANKLVDDAEEKQMTTPTVRKWLDNLKDAIYCVGELLDEINTEALRRQLEGDDDHFPAASSSSTSWITRSVLKFSSRSDEFHNSLEPKISNILRVLDLILKEKDVLGLKEGVQHRPQDTTRQTTSRFDESGVFGREKDRETILEALLSDDTTGAKIGVLPIVGMGGMGKSTLAQLVYKDVKDDFDVQAWVFVGEEFGILQIAQTIYGRITDQTCGITDLDLLSERLEKVLTGKKFLFVLDDVWSEDYLLWNNLMTHFNSCGVHGSKIIVTTRLGSVASITGTLLAHYLEEISEDDSWLLFARHAFTDAGVITAHPYLEVIGRQIVKKCQGLPLATKSLGGLLHSNLNPKEWEKILKSDLWKLSNDKILPALWLSYHYLPPHLKRCFAYCSIFPKGYIFKKSELSLLWMAEDLLQSNEEGALDPEEVGSYYFDILSSRSFFQHSSYKFGGSKITMHDLVNDLAKFVAGEFCLRLEENQPPNKMCKTRHFSFMKFGGHGIQKFEALDEAKHLHTFLQLESDYGGNKLVLNYTLVDLLPNLPCLRVLKLSNTGIDELPSSIGNLKQLRHLDVSGTSITELPETVCTLYNLQTLLLVDLIQLPSNLGRLINLRHLDIHDASDHSDTKIKMMPAGMCNLKNLQTLSDFVVDKQTPQRIGELKELQHLRGRLRISGVDCIEHEGNALEADIMSNKEYLDELVLTWGIRKVEDIEEYVWIDCFLRDGRGVYDNDPNHDPENEREVLNKLQPHTNLKQLVINSYWGLKFPGWLGDPYFSKLFSIRLTDCKHCCLLPPLWQLPSLKQLHVRGMNNVVEIGSEFYGNDTCGITPFGSLEELFLEDMLACEKWSYYDGSRGNTTIMFPKLRLLELERCPKLTKIVPLEKLPRLERVKLRRLESFSGSLAHVESKCPKFLSLTRLEMDECPNFVCFPDGGMDAPKLEELLINRCRKLRSLPEQMHTLLPSLWNLKVFGCPEVESFPQGGEIMFPNLRRLELVNYPNLTEIVPLEKLPRLEWVKLCSLESFNGLLAHVESKCPKFLSLVHLEIDYCPNFVCFPDGGMDAPKLEELLINGCKKLRSLPEQMHTLLPSLQKLEVVRCPEVESFRQGGGIMFPNLRQLELGNCPKLTEIVPLEKLQSLERVKLHDLESFSGSLAHVESKCPKFLSLTRLEMVECPNFVCFPDGGMDAPKLEELFINGCKKLRSLPEQMHTLLPFLVKLEVVSCPEVESFPQGGGIMFPNLRRLELRNCPKLTEIVPLEKLPRLGWVKLRRLESFSGSLAHVESKCPKFLSLTSLEMVECPNFVCFPDGGMDAPKLEELFINGCKKLRSLPEQMHTLLPFLWKLEVVGCPEVESFPQGGGIMFPNLRWLELRNCPKLTEIVPLEKLPRLERVKLHDLESFSGSLAHVESKCPKFLSLTSLEMDECPNFVCFPDGGMDAPKLKELLINGCKKLRSLPEQMHTLLPFLWKLEVVGCPEVESFPQGGGIMFPNLRELELERCPKLTEIVPLEKLPRLERVKLHGLESFSGSLAHVESKCPKFLSLTRLEMVECPNFVCFPDGGMDAPKLEELFINGCKKLRSLPEQMHTLLPSLQKLKVFGCPEMESFPQGGGIMFPNLRRLELRNCPKLTEIVPLEKLPRLEWVKLHGLESFSGSPKCPKFLSLTHLEMDECPNFVCFPDGGMDAPKLEELFINGCKKLRSLPEQMHTLLPSLWNLKVFGCPEVESFPQGGGIMFPNLRRLELRNCPKLTEIVPLEKLPRLEWVKLHGLESFSGSPKCPKFLSLTHLEMDECPNFVCFPDGGMDAPKLKELLINGCKKLRSLPEQMHTLLPSLQKLKVFGCPEMELFPQGELLSNVQDLSFECCGKLAAKRSLWGLTRLNSLRKLEIKFTKEGGEEMGCSFPDEGLLPTALTRLSIVSHPNLTTIQGKVLRQLTSLEDLTIEECPELQCFLEEAPKSLKSLTIRKCPNIRCLPGEWLPTSLSYMVIKCCPLLEERFQRETGEDWPKIAHIRMYTY